MDMGFQCDIDDARYGQLDHDTVCVIQAGQLLDMNCLEYETAAYGLVYRQNKEIILLYFIQKRYNAGFYKNGLYGGFALYAGKVLF